MSTFSATFFLPRLRPRILHISSACVRRNASAGRVASFQSQATARSWFKQGDMDSQAKKWPENAESTDSPSDAQQARNVADFYRVEPVSDRTIHILGLGSVGRFIAHALRGLPDPPPIRLLTHTALRLRDWEASRKEITVKTGDSVERRGGFEMEIVDRVPRYKDEEVDIERNSWSEEPIPHLIVCVKAHQVLAALSGLKHRLGPGSVVCLMQNGMGIVEELNEKLFTDPETRPSWMLGINSHGTNTVKGDPFAVTHAGFGTISLGLLPRDSFDLHAPHSPVQRFGPNGEPVPQGFNPPQDPFADPPRPQFGKEWSTSERYLLGTLLRAPVLCATAFAPPDLLQLQLEKLAVNCIINPLTVLMDARNGTLLYNYHITRIMRLLLAEISLVITSLPELQYIPNVSQRFEASRLETQVLGVADKTSDNISSMLADVRRGNSTEIDYINGWVVNRGHELGMRCTMNYMMQQLVHGKKVMIQQELSRGTPLAELELQDVEEMEQRERGGIV